MCSYFLILLLFGKVMANSWFKLMIAENKKSQKRQKLSNSTIWPKNKNKQWEAYSHVNTNYNHTHGFGLGLDLDQLWLLISFGFGYALAFSSDLASA